MENDLILSKEGCKILGWDDDKKGTICRIDSADKFSGRDREIVNRVLLAREKWLSESKDCVFCKESLSKRNGSVCAKHFHDYQVCYDDHCISCFVYRSVSVHFPKAVEKYLWAW